MGGMAEEIEMKDVSGTETKKALFWIEGGGGYRTSKKSTRKGTRKGTLRREKRADKLLKKQRREAMARGKKN